MTYESWFNKLRNWALKGVNLEGNIHKMSPVAKGKTWEKFTCPQCKSGNSFLFRSHNNGNLYVTFCMKCNKPSDVSEEVVKEKASLCKGIKVGGAPCKFKALPGSEYCGHHS